MDGTNFKQRIFANEPLNLGDYWYPPSPRHVGASADEVRLQTDTLWLCRTRVGLPEGQRSNQPIKRSLNNLVIGAHHNSATKSS